jgi:hypothetical protein
MTATVYKPSWLKAAIVLVAGFLLLLFVLEPFQCHAQAEINPDHYEITGGEPISQAGNSATAARNAGEFRGTFTLPFDVRCAGLTLPSGPYSLSIHSLAKSDEVTLIPKGNAIMIQARVASRSSAGGASALVVERTGQRRTLTAIRLKEPGITLYLQAAQRRSASADAEVVPIS